MPLVKDNTWKWSLVVPYSDADFYMVDETNRKVGDLGGTTSTSLFVTFSGKNYFLRSNWIGPRIYEWQIWRENNFQILKISRLCLTSTCVFEIRLEFPMDVLREVLHIFFRTRVRINCQWCARDSSRILSIAFQPTFHHRIRWYISSLLLSGQYLRWDLYSSAISKAE